MNFVMLSFFIREIYLNICLKPFTYFPKLPIDNFDNLTYSYRCLQSYLHLPVSINPTDLYSVLSDQSAVCFEV